LRGSGGVPESAFQGGRRRKETRPEAVRAPSGARPSPRERDGSLERLNAVFKKRLRFGESSVNRFTGCPARGCGWFPDVRGFLAGQAFDVMRSACRARKDS